MGNQTLKPKAKDGLKSVYPPACIFMTQSGPVLPGPATDGLDAGKKGRDLALRTTLLKIAETQSAHP